LNRIVAQPRGGSDKTECTAGERCQCPCYTSTDYSYCSGHFTITESVSLQCLRLEHGLVHLYTWQMWTDLQIVFNHKIP